MYTSSGQHSPIHRTLEPPQQGMTAITSVQTLKNQGYVFSPLETGGEKNKSFSTLLLGVKDRGKPLVLKVFFKNTPEGERRDNSLPLERTIYKQLLRPLLRTRTTPNLLRYYGSFSESYDDARGALDECADTLDKLRKRVKAKEIRDHGPDGIRLRDVDKLIIVGLEYVRAHTLRRWLQTERPYDELKSVLFQIIYTAESLYRAGIRHNDLHVGNVLIDVNATCDKLYYQLSDNRKFAAPVRKSLVKLCDFNSACGIRSQRSRSHRPGQMPRYYNYRLKYYKYWHQYGMTDVDNPRYDTFTILSSMAGALRKYHGSSEFADLITERFIISQPLLRCPWKFAHRMGKKKDGTFFHDSQNTDRADYVPGDDEVRGNMAILNDDIFADWRIAPAQFDARQMERPSDLYVLPAHPSGPTQPAAARQGDRA